jgi:predicted DNA-binding ribbon-helix-helix protein
VIIAKQHQTSITLEDEFYDVLLKISHEKGMPVSELITLIDEKREISNLSSAVRVFILQELLAKLDV